MKFSTLQDNFKLVSLLLLIGIIALSGCIYGEVTDTVNSDGSIHRFLELDKSGLLVNADCKSLKSLMQMSGNVSISTLEKIDKYCRETKSSIIIEADLPYGDKENPVRIIEKEDGKYLRYETNITSFFIIKVKMPSEVVILHNGELLDKYTVGFKGEVGDLWKVGETAQKIGYVECRKPEIGFTALFVNTTTLSVLGVIIVAIASIVIYWYFLRRR